jgi:tetratricopeptide (TPR) repeat protein
MKSEHRHELKTNELAEWLSNLPQWTKENLTIIIVISAVIVAAITFYYIRYGYRKSVVAEEQLEFTNLLNQLSASKMQVLSAQAQGRDLSFILLQPANSLGTFAQNAKSDQMAALALIKQAEALRTELHYRPGTVSNKDLTSQINQAKAAYTEAIQTRLQGTSNPSLTAAAEFGLGLCEEELGNFEKAQQIYQIIAENPDFEGTVAVAQAKHRLETMADYKQKVIFKPAPTPPAASLPPATSGGQTTGAATEPTIQIKPVDTNLPAEVILPIDVNQASQTSNVLPDVNSKVPEPNVSVK